MNNEPQNNSSDEPLSVEARIELQKRVVEDLRRIFPKQDSKKFDALFEQPEEIKKPSKWSSKSNPPYYRERYALQIRDVLDSMIADYDNKIYDERMFYFKDVPELSPNSLYLKINQSKLYLLDNLDPDKKYRQFDFLIRVKKVPGIGVKMFYKDGVLVADENGNSVRNAVNVINPIQQKTLSDEIETWLQNAKPHEQFHKKKLFLTDHEVSVLQSSLGGLDDIAANIKHNEVILVKLPPDPKMI